MLLYKYIQNTVSCEQSLLVVIALWVLCSWLTLSKKFDEVPVTSFNFLLTKINDVNYISTIYFFRNTAMIKRFAGTLLLLYINV